MAGKKSTQGILTSTNGRPPLSRRGSKPQVEKKRRARINHSLSELQELMVDIDKIKSGSRIEKADILEMTVRYLKSIKRENNTDQSNAESKVESKAIEPKAIPKSPFKEGYLRCASDLSKYLKNTEKSSPAFQKRVKSYLLREADLSDRPSTATSAESAEKIRTASESSPLWENDNSDTRSSIISPTSSIGGFRPVIPVEFPSSQWDYLMPANSYDNFHIQSNHRFAYNSSIQHGSYPSHPTPLVPFSYYNFRPSPSMFEDPCPNNLSPRQGMETEHNSMWRPW